jgi:hypothetical protein
MEYSIQDTVASEISFEKELETSIGGKAIALLSDINFQNKWDILHERCPWATVFQSRSFVTTWYNIYQSKHQPIIIKGTKGEELVGLLTLTIDSKGIITGAGTSQAEYHVWLATEDQEWFIQKAIANLLKIFPGKKINLKYAPGESPIDHIGNDVTLKKRCLIRTVKQPLLETQEEIIDKELKKKNRREKINRLKRLGNLSLERITGLEDFLSVFDEIALQFEFRKEVIYKTTFFKSDSFRKSFLLELFEHGLLHVTVLKLNDEIIASNVGLISNNWVHLQGLNAHSPIYSKFSPGILHFLMLAKLLNKEGFAVFDLTPGADAYKESLATNFIFATEITISSVSDKLIKNFRLKVVEYLKSGALKCGIGINEIASFKRKKTFFLNRLEKYKKWDLPIFLNGFLLKDKAYNKTRVACDTKESINDQQIFKNKVNKCSLQDLMYFQETPALFTRWDFLKEAMERLEQGEVCYTYSENAVLIYCLWIKLQRESDPNKVDEAHKLYCHPEGEPRLMNFLRYISEEILPDNINLDQIYTNQSTP